MKQAEIDRDVTLWLVDELPARMFYAGRWWVVTDTPTRLRDSIWSVDPTEGVAGQGLYGWRFQGADCDGAVFVFDVYGGPEGWHVHRTYA